MSAKSDGVVRHSTNQGVKQIRNERCCGAQAVLAPFALTLAACGEQAADETTADEMAPAEAVDETVVVEETPVADPMATEGAMMEETVTATETPMAEETTPAE